MTLSAVEQFDKMLGTGKINTERGQNYGHPVDDFALAHKLCQLINSMPEVELRETAKRIQVKIARLVSNPLHVDGWIDIAGYARCAVMIIDALQERAIPINAKHNATGPWGLSVCEHCACPDGTHIVSCPNANK